MSLCAACTNAGDLGVRGGVSSGIDVNEGYLVGLDLSNLAPDSAFQITKVAFATMSNLNSEQVTFVNRNDTSKTLVVDSNPTNPNVDVSALDLIVQGGTSDSELLSVFNSSSTVQGWRVISFEITAFTADLLPPTSANLAISSDGANVTIVATGVTVGSQNQLQSKDDLVLDGFWGTDIDVPKSGDTTHAWVIPATNPAVFYNVKSYND